VPDSYDCDSFVLLHLFQVNEVSLRHAAVIILTLRALNVKRLRLELRAIQHLILLVLCDRHYFLQKSKLWNLHLGCSLHCLFAFLAHSKAICTSLPQCRSDYKPSGRNCLFGTVLLHQFFQLSIKFGADLDVRYVCTIFFNNNFQLF
jgi:hypothetical protein